MICSWFAALQQIQIVLFRYPQAPDPDGRPYLFYAVHESGKNKLRLALVLTSPGGSGRCGRWFLKVQDDFCRRLQEMCGACEVHITGSVQHVFEVARNTAEGGTGLIIAVGGDGTLSEVCPGLNCYAVAIASQ